MKCLNIALAQINPTVGALRANADHMIDTAIAAVREGADLVVFPELALSGYPPEDLVLKSHFIAGCADQFTRLETHLPPEAAVVIGSPYGLDGQVYNAAVCFFGGRRVGHYFKQVLPNYGVFDEQRIFTAGHRPCILQTDTLRHGLHICEDGWHVDGRACRGLSRIRLDTVINISASPYHRRKKQERMERLHQVAAKLNAPLVYVNLTGGQDELVFDGGSLVMQPDGRIIHQAPVFEESITCCSMPVAEKLEHPAPDAFTDWIYIPPRVIGHRRHEPCSTEPLEPEEEIYCALKTGLHDYARKNGFGDVIVALSGGIDSALVAVIAADALGPGRVHAVTMPSPYTSAGTLEDARLLAANLGIELQTIPIGGLIQAYAGPLASCGQDHAPGVTGENLQARIRGNIVMALSNTFGRLVLATGNKSEMATGYCTLYGDMAGGFAVIKDVPKTMVYRLARWRNTRNCPPPIPARIISRPPSAELRPGQQDTDTLPPYDVLDRILEAYVEQDRDLDDIVSDGHESGLVEKVIRLVDHSEYKRRQAPPGIKITPRAFGRDRRMPITNHFTRRA